MENRDGRRRNWGTLSGMSEPINPGRWNVEATTAWRRRLSDCDVSRFRHPDPSSSTELPGGEPGSEPGGEPGGEHGGQRGAPIDRPRDRRLVTGLLAGKAPLYEAEGVALVAAVARECRPGADGSFPSVDRVLAGLVVTAAGDIEFAGAEEGPPTGDDGGTAPGVVRQLLELLDRLIARGPVSGELARVRLGVAREGERADPAELAAALAPLAAPSLADWLTRTEVESSARIPVATEVPATPVTPAARRAGGGDVGDERARAARPARAAGPGDKRLGDKSWRLWGLVGTVLLGVAAWLAIGLAGPARSTSTSSSTQPPAVVEAEPTPVSPSVEPVTPAVPPAVTPPLAAKAAAKVAAVDWDAVVAKVDADRRISLEDLDEDALRRVHAPGSAALRADLRLVGALRARKLRPIGLVTIVSAVEPVRVGTDHAVLRVMDRRSGYDLVDLTTGAVHERMPPRGDRTWLLTLSRDDGDWAISAVVAAPT